MGLVSGLTAAQKGGNLRLGRRAAAEAPGTCCSAMKFGSASRLGFGGYAALDVSDGVSRESTLVSLRGERASLPWSSPTSPDWLSTGSSPVPGGRG
jgi:hypothetical protein